MIGSDVLDQTKPKIKNRALGYKRMRLPRSPRRPRNDDENENFEIFDYDPLNYIVGDEECILQLMIWPSGAGRGMKKYWLAEKFG